MPDKSAGRLPATLREITERIAFPALAGCVSMALISIAAAEILLVISSLAACLILIRKGRSALQLPPVFLPLLLFFIWTFVTALASAHRYENLTGLRKFALYLILFLVPIIARTPKSITWIYRAVLVAALLASCMGMIQYATDSQSDLLHRITGFMSHWMTYSGQLMLVLIALAAYLFGSGRYWRMILIPLGILLIIPLVFSETRNAWLGTIAGMIVVLLLLKPRALTILTIALVALYLASPANIKTRFRSGWDLNDPNTQNRIELFETSVRVIQNHPWLGVGQNSVKETALKFRGNYDYPDWMYQHMHNNFLQIAAERGIPGLLLWFWFMGRLAWDAWLVFRNARRESLVGVNGSHNEASIASTAALGAFAALLVAGMFEYNFGDSEIMILFLFMMSAPYAFIEGPKDRDLDRVQTSSIKDAAQ
jgi:putative inorganic carbon (HCO3(-)) transporter